MQPMMLAKRIFAFHRLNQFGIDPIAMANNPPRVDARVSEPLPHVAAQDDHPVGGAIGTPNQSAERPDRRAITDPSQRNADVRVNVLQINDQLGPAERRMYQPIRQMSGGSVSTTTTSGRSLQAAAHIAATKKLR